MSQKKPEVKKLIQHGVIAYEVADTAMTGMRREAKEKLASHQRERVMYEFGQVAPKCMGCAKAEVTSDYDPLHNRQQYAMRCDTGNDVYVRCPDGEQFQRQGAKWVQVEPIPYSVINDGDKIRGISADRIWIDETNDAKYAQERFRPAPEPVIYRPPDVPSTTIDAW